MNDKLSIPAGTEISLNTTLGCRLVSRKTGAEASFLIRQAVGV